MKIKKQILIVLMIISVFINTFIYTNPVQAANSTKATNTILIIFNNHCAKNELCIPNI